MCREHLSRIQSIATIVYVFAMWPMWHPGVTSWDIATCQCANTIMWQSLVTQPWPPNYRGHSSLTSTLGWTIITTSINSCHTGHNNLLLINCNSEDIWRLRWHMDRKWLSLHLLQNADSFSTDPCIVFWQQWIINNPPSIKSQVQMSLL